MTNPENFLAEKYGDLPGSKPVERAVQKKIRKGEKGPSTKEDRVGAYLERLEDIIKDERGFELLKHKILERYTTKPEDIPESYWKSLSEEMRRRGEAGDWENASEEQRSELKQKNAEIVLSDQRDSLEEWVDYFGSSDSDDIPPSLKYWVFRNVLGLADLVKKKEGDREYIEFPKRSKGTVKPYPDLNHEALSYVVDAVIKHREGKGIEFEYDIQPEEREEFNKFLAKENFAKLYGWANELMTPIPEHLLPVTDGEWIKYKQNSDPNELVKTIRGKGTGWCTAGINTARTHLEGGDFYVYYSKDDDGEPTVPRLAIRMQGHDKIAEDPRGIAYKQNLDPYMAPVLEKKLEEFGPVGEEYKKKSGDMRKLTEIDAKTKQNQEFSKEDLVFLYELNGQIEGFGYQKDPRIKELRGQRNVEQDMCIIFECQPEQIVHNPKKITKNTKAYVGELEAGIFELAKIYNIEHIYTSFPEGIIRRQELEIGGKTAEELEKELREKGINISSYAMDMLRKMAEDKNSAPQENPENISLIRLTVKDLGFAVGATTEEIYQRAEELGLELCPAEVGPHLCLQYINQPMNEWVFIGMEQIADRDGYPCVFSLVRYAYGLWLHGSWAKPEDGWRPFITFVFRLRKF